MKLGKLISKKPQQGTHCREAYGLKTQPCNGLPEHGGNCQISLARKDRPNWGEKDVQRGRKKRRNQIASWISACCHVMKPSECIYRWKTEGLTPSSAAPERSAGHQQRSCWRQLQRNVRPHTRRQPGVRDGLQCQPDQTTLPCRLPLRMASDMR
jgi:hypothetical protein